MDQRAGAHAEDQGTGEHTGNPQGTCFPVPLTVTYRGSEGHVYLTTQVLSAEIFISAVLADIDLKEQHLIPP